MNEQWTKLNEPEKETIEQKKGLLRKDLIKTNELNQIFLGGLVHYPTKAVPA